MWTVVYLASNKEKAKEVARLLEENNILVKIRPLDRNASEKENSCEVLVCESDVSNAHSIIIDMGF